MVSYITRRKRWVLRLKYLDSNTKVSDKILASCLLDCAGLSETEKLMIKTACGNRMSFDEIAATLRRQHPKTQDHETRRSTFDKPTETRPFKPWQDRRSTEAGRLSTKEVVEALLQAMASALRLLGAGL